MSTFSDETMMIIKAIKEFIIKNPNSDAIENYYLVHGSFVGIVEYLKEIMKHDSNSWNTYIILVICPNIFVEDPIILFMTIRS